LLPSKIAKTGEIQTVLGPIMPDDLGITMTHEHLLMDIPVYETHPEEASKSRFKTGSWNFEMISKGNELWSVNRNNLTLNDENEIIEQVLDYKYSGGNSLVDCTNYDLAQDPNGLTRISRATGLNIIMGCGHYVPAAHPNDIESKTKDDLTKRMVRDIVDGIGDTNIRPGIIGEIGNIWPITEIQQRLLESAADAHKETGLPILIHPGSDDRSPLKIIDILVNCDVAPEAIIMGHLDFAIQYKSRETLDELAQTGCFMEYDIFGFEESGLFVRGNYGELSNDHKRIDTIIFLLDKGYGNQLVVGQDVCLKRHQSKYGGKGYSHILKTIVPKMLNIGVSKSDVDNILVNNPANALQKR